MFSSFLSIFAHFRAENLSDQVKCCEKGSRGKTQIRQKSVAKRGQCCEKGVLRKGRPPVYKNLEHTLVFIIPFSCYNFVLANCLLSLTPISSNSPKTLDCLKSFVRLKMQVRREQKWSWFKTKLCNRKLKINRKKIQFNKSIFRKPPSERLKTAAELAPK